MADTDETPSGAALEALSDAVGAVAGELDVETVLQLIVDRVRSLVGAHYAALGIVDDQRRIERFITSGISVELRTALGPLPEGHGLLGLIITEGRSLRIPEIGAHPGELRLSAAPPADAIAARRACADQGPHHRQLLPDRQGRRRPNSATTISGSIELFALHAGIAIENARLHEAVGTARRDRGARPDRQGPPRRHHPELYAVRCRSRTCPS